MATEAAPKIRTFDWWGAVPPDYASRTQLADADLPRKPGGPVRARVWGKDWSGDDDQLIDLYAVAESEPTRTSAGALAAKPDRAVRVCADCGACCQRPLRSRDGRHRCPACSVVARLVERQIELREEREQASAWAARVLADPAAAVVQVDLVAAPPTESGRARPPLAARIVAVDGAGGPLVDVLVRLAGPRAEGVPPKAVEPEAGARKLAKGLAGRTRLVCWDGGQALDTAVARLRARGQELAIPRQFTGQGPTVAHRAAAWRGEIDPSTGKLREPWPPGTAGRLHLLLSWMSSCSEGRPGTSGRARMNAAGIYGTSGRWGSYPVQIAVTGPAGAGERLAGVLEATGLLEPRAVHGPVPSREIPGQQVTYLGGGKALLVDAEQVGR